MADISNDNAGEKIEECARHDAARWADYRRGCFLLSRDAAAAQADGSFERRAGELLELAENVLQDRSLGIDIMERMLARGEEYYRFLEQESPILVYKGDKICYGVLNGFAESMIRALRARGETVEEYDIGAQDVGGLSGLVGRTYKAVIGFQTFIFSVRMKDGRNLHDLIHGPKFHFIFDHPLWLKGHLEQGPRDYYILTHGEDYRAFVGRYFKNEVKKCFLLPPAGVKQDKGGMERTLDVTFVGTWHDYRERLAYIRSTKTRERYVANRFLLIMKKNPNLTAEAAFEKALAYYDITLDDDAFKKALFEYKQVCFCIMTYYREKVIRRLLADGIGIHVYGESWTKSPFAHDPHLICHRGLTVEESFAVWKKSKLSLNVMSWHKGGFTERIANMLLCGTVAVSDKSGYLEEHFADGKDILLFDLTELDRLPGRIREYLADDGKRERVAAAGRKKAEAEHTWERRTEQFLQILKATREE